MLRFLSKYYIIIVSVFAVTLYFTGCSSSPSTELPPPPPAGSAPPEKSIDKEIVFEKSEMDLDLDMDLDLMPDWYTNPPVSADMITVTSSARSNSKESSLKQATAQAEQAIVNKVLELADNFQGRYGDKLGSHPNTIKDIKAFADSSAALLSKSATVVNQEIKKNGSVFRAAVLLQTDSFSQAKFDSTLLASKPGFLKKIK